MAETKGTIFRIRRFSIHDGPGIRTSVFLKGCPLRCSWCHSPEGIDAQISVWHTPGLCISCKRCLTACHNEALKMSSGSVLIDRAKCTLTGGCTEVCPAGAMQFTGRTITAQEVFREVRKDIAFYGTSGGGLTLTGGEPLFQPEFSLEILELCRKAGIHTAIETSLFADLDVAEKISSAADLIIADLKIFDPQEHETYTGQSNEKITGNFLFLAETGRALTVRIPLIPGITDTAENINAISAFAGSAGRNIPVELIEYNPLAANNYRRLGIPFQPDRVFNKDNL
jgi:pyruvate formate lyase activating enzyme